jgi:opine dehydrogenase
VLVAILGAGNGGQATAAHLTLLGHTVRLYDRFPEIIEPLLADRRIMLKGAVSGEAIVSEITNDVDIAVRDADLVLITVPGFAIEWMAGAVAPHLTPGQIVVLHPGGTGGSLEVREVWRRMGAGDRVLLAETETLVYACRLTAPGFLDIAALKQDLWLASLPASDLAPALEVFSKFYPQVRAAPNVLATGLANMNAVIHPAVALHNAGLIDRRADGFDFYRDGVSRSVGRIVAAVDRERMAIASVLGVKASSYRAWIASHYGVTAPTVVELFERLAADVYRGIGTPESMEARYVSEDVPMALVPMEALGGLVGVATPTMGSIITLCSSINEIDYRATGRTLKRLGLTGLTGSQVMELVRQARVSPHG